MISAETVTEVWQRMAQMSPQQAQQVVQQMDQRQPALLAHLLFLEDYPFNQHEREIIFYLGIVVWQMMMQGGHPLGRVTPEIVVEADEANYKFMERIAADTEADFVSAVQGMLDRYPEPEVLRYIVEAIMEEGDPQDPPIRDEYTGLAFIHLKSALDALVQSRPEAPEGDQSA